MISLIFILLELIFFFIIFYLPDLLISLMIQNLDLFNNLFVLSIYALVYIIEITCLIFYILYIKKEKPKNWGLQGFSSKDIHKTITLYLFIFLIYLVIITIVSLLPKEILIKLSEGHRWTLNNINMVPFILVFCLLTGLKEEIYFRAFMINRLKTWGLPFWAAILLSSSIFGILHLYESIMAVVFALSSAILFGYFYHKWKNLYILSIAHGLFNFTMLLMSYFLKDQINIGN